MGFTNKANAQHSFFYGPLLFGILFFQTSFENDPQAALVEFQTTREAKQALNCPDAILGNRFIKMFWHQSNRGAPNQQGGNPAQSAINNVSRYITWKTIILTIMQNKYRQVATFTVEFVLPL